MKSLLSLSLIATLIGTVSPLNAQEQDDPIEQLNDYMNQLNLQLEDEGANYRVGLAEALTSADSEYIGVTVIAKDVGNKQLAFDFVPGDIRRIWSGGNPNEITYAIDTTNDAVPPYGGLTEAKTTSAIQRAMNTWNALKCSNLSLSQNSNFGLDIGIVAFLNGFGGNPFIFADIQHAGWRDIDFSAGIIGITFTFLFIGDDGNPTDIDSNGKGDTSFREIYYDPSFSWTDNGLGLPDIDVETVALHETGHALGQAHFGTISIKKGILSAKPRAVMNAIYSSPLNKVKGTDNGGHCSNWAQWPNN